MLPLFLGCFRKLFCIGTKGGFPHSNFITKQLYSIDKKILLRRITKVIYLGLPMEDKSNAFLSSSEFFEPIITMSPEVNLNSTPSLPVIL
ncbi:hypothetical protein SAMN05443252_106288 [Bacillus sp. OV322]|nr:hypothetical protein SAMN05443252_106288 [Bacillus sp. OV322]